MDCSQKHKKLISKSTSNLQKFVVNIKSKLKKLELTIIIVIVIITWIREWWKL